MRDEKIRFKDEFLEFRKECSNSTAVNVQIQAEVSELRSKNDILVEDEAAHLTNASKLQKEQWKWCHRPQFRNELSTARDMAHRVATNASYTLDVIRAKEFFINKLKHGLRQSDDALSMLHGELQKTNATDDKIENNKKKIIIIIGKEQFIKRSLKKSIFLSFSYAQMDFWQTKLAPLLSPK